MLQMYQDIGQDRSKLILALKVKPDLGLHCGQKHTVLPSYSKLTFNPLPIDKFIDWSKSKALADSRINVTEKVQFDLGRVENIMGKWENAGYQHFLLFP